jgi:hypothetical protein
VIAAVVAAVDQLYVDAPLAVKVTEFPAQILVLPEAVMLTVAVLANVVTAEDALAVQPFAAVPTTVYVPAVFALIAAVVAEVDHT